MAATCPSRSLRLTAELHDLAHIRRFVRESAASFGMAPADLSKVVLAVDEAVTNIILYGYSGLGGALEVDVSNPPGALVIRLRDNAPPFDPTRVSLPDFTLAAEERMPGGLGIYLIGQAVDEMWYCRQPSGGNELTLSKRIP